MTWVALSFAIAAVAMTFFFRSQTHAIVLALEEAKAKEAELSRTLVDILDESGQIRGQLSLPGKVHTDEAVVKLRSATEEMEKIRNELRESRGDRKKIETLVEAINEGSSVQIRLPGTTVSPDRTPCGALCKLSFFAKEGRLGNTDRQSGQWRCKAGLGNETAIARKKFVDANSQCVMFERKSDA